MKKTKNICTFSAVIFILAVLSTNFSDFGDCKIYSIHSQRMSIWSEGHVANILNPDEYPDYPNWRGREWRLWFQRQRKKLSHTTEEGIHRMRHMEPVIIVRPDDLIAAFKGQLDQYGTKNQAMVWSRHSLPTFVLQKGGKKVRVFNCGSMYIAGRLLNGIPVYLHDFYPFPIRNPLGGHIRYPVSKYCNPIPPF